MVPGRDEQCYDSPMNEYETCSWCTDEVPDADLTEISDGARLCCICLDVALDEGFTELY